MKKKEKITYNGLELDSVSELELIYYLEECIEYGLVEYWVKDETLPLSEPAKNTYEIQLKTKNKEITQTLMQGHVYTYDFRIKFTDLGKKALCSVIGTKITNFFILDSLTGFSYIESKPGKFDFANMERLVKINIKWVWQKYGIFVQIVKNEELFEKTFTPKKCLLTKTGKSRKINWKVRSIEEFLKLKK